MAANNPIILQTVTAASSAAAPSTATITFAPTQAGSLLVLLAGAAMSAAGSIGAPTGWTGVQGAGAGDPGNAILGSIMYLANNAGGITTVTTGALTNVNGIALIGYEVSNMGAGALPDPAVSRQSFSSSATTRAQSATVAVSGEVWFAILMSLTGQAITNTATPSSGPGAWTATATITSTLGATNVQAIGLIGQPGAVQPVTVGGVMAPSLSLAGALACGVSMTSFPSLTSGTARAANDAGSAGVIVAGGAGYAVGG